VLTQLTRRTVGLVVGIFAALGFLAVPLGERTGFQHSRAILTSREARDFVRELEHAKDDLKKRVLGEIGSDKAPAEPKQPMTLTEARDASVDAGP
jgi:hypothetical protein